MLQARLDPNVHLSAGHSVATTARPPGPTKWRRWQSAGFAVGSSLVLWTLIISAVDWVV